MKKKDIKKIAKEVFKLNQRAERPSKRGLGAIEEPAPTEPYHSIGDYNEEISDKFFKFVISLLKYPDNLNMSLNSEYLEISCSDIANIKKPKPNPNNLNGAILRSGSADMRITVSKSLFTISHGYSNMTMYQDNTMYHRLEKYAKETMDIKNANCFNEIWNYISKESGLLRDSNLDEILS